MKTLKTFFKIIITIDLQFFDMQETDRSPHLPAVYIKYDNFCEEVFLAVHRVHVLLTLWDIG